MSDRGSRLQNPIPWSLAAGWLIVALLACSLSPGSASAFIPRWIAEPSASADRSVAGVRALPTSPMDPSIAQGREDFDVQAYTIALFPDFGTGNLTGHVSIQSRSLRDNLQSVELDLFSEFEVNAVLAGNQPLSFSHVDDILRVELDAPRATDETFGISISYSGSPVPSGFMGFEFRQTPAGRPILATLSQPFFARSWWPCKDTPVDKATVTVGVLAPEGMFAASNGRLVSQSPSGTGTWFVWEEDYPISTYNVSLAITEYVSWSENYTSPGGQSYPLEYHVFPEHEDLARYEFERTPQILDFFNLTFGEYPFPQDKYGTAEFVWEGAMEHQTMTSYGDFFLTGDRYYEYIIAHELSHQWWGNSMTLTDWTDLWIHEGLATYSSALWIEHIDGRAAYDRFLRMRSNGCCGFNGPILPPDSLFNQTVYNKSAWVFHMLRRMLGDATFFDCLRDLAARLDLQYGSVTTADVVAQFSQTSGQDLQWFFDQWLLREGRPTFYVQTSSSQDTSGLHEFSVRVVQDDAQDPWTFPLTVRVRTANFTFDIPLDVSDRVTELTGHLPSEALEVTVDPEDDLLHHLQPTPVITSAPGSAVSRTRLLPNVPNPFNPRTEIRFELARTANVRLSIYDMRGRRVRSLELGSLAPGFHSQVWDGTDIAGRPVSSGIYHVRLEGVGEDTTARSITLIR